MRGAHKLGLLGAILAAALAVVLAPGDRTANAEAPSPSTPPPGSLRIQARAGFDGYGRVGGWAPVVTDIFNEAPQGFSGELKVRVSSGTARGNFASAPTVYAVPVAVPGRSHRRYSLDVRIPTVNTRTEATLVAARSDEVLAEQEVPIVRVPLGELFCAVIGRDARNYDFLTALDLPPPVRRARVAPLSPLELPTVGHLLGSFDCIILDGANSTQFRPEQLQALQVWLNGGGLLIAVGGTGWRANLSALPPSVLPVEPLGLTSVESLEALAELTGVPLEHAGPWLVTRSRLRGGMGAGRVVASEEGNPLVVAAKRGDGGVIYIAFDPANPALMSWQGQAELWRYVLTHASVDAGTGSALVRPYLRWGRAPRWALSDYSAQPRPNNVWLLPISMGAAAVGGGGALILGARRRPGAAVAALVATGLVSTGAALALARGHAEPDVEVNTVSIIRPVGLGETAYTRTYVAAWPHREGHYTFQLPPRALAFTLWFPSPRPSDESDLNWQLTQVETQAPEIRSLHLPSERLSTFGFDGQVASSVVRLETDLVLDAEDRLRGTITNAMAQPFENAALVIDTRIVKLGTLAPGQTVNVDTVVPASASAGYVAAQGIPNALLGEPARDQPPIARRDVLDGLFLQRFLVRRAEVRGPTLVGWLPRDPVDVAVSAGGSSSVRGSALLMAPAGVRLLLGYEGPIPSSLLIRRDMGGAPTFSPDRDFYTVSSGESINVQYTLPPSEGPWSVQELLVNFQIQPLAVRQRLPADLDRVSLFNWRTGEWQDWQLGARSARIPDPEDFVSATGDVRLRFRMDSGSSSQVRQVNVTRFDVTPHVRVASG